MTIYITRPITRHLIPAIKAAAPDAQIHYDAKYAREAEIVVGNAPLDDLLANPNLRLVQLRSSGTAAYPELLKRRPELRLCSATGAYGHAVAEHMLAALLCMMKRLDEYARKQRSHAWTDLGSAATIRGAHVLILGLGDIGCEFGRMARALGARVTGLRRSARPQTDAADSVYDMRALPDLLPKADVIAMALPETPETRNIMNAERFALVKRGAYLLNAGRGSAVDERALIRSLEDGKLAGAFLDVTQTEPLPEGDPLWYAPNIFITPHVAGGDHLDTIGQEIARITANNIRALIYGGEFISLVDADTSYRAL